MKCHIIIVEDEVAIAQNYCEALKRQGYDVTHFSARAPAMEYLRERLPDLAIIDIGLGHEPEGGFELCRELRARAPQLPIMFLTARIDDLDVISGLRLGADDYLTKDISQAHMLARVTALLRRVEVLKQAPTSEQVLARGDLELDIDRMRALWQGHALDLTVTEFWIVHALARHPGHVKNRQQLMDAANVVLDDSTVTSHIKRIRRKFKAVDPGFAAIDTAYGFGYRWTK